MELTRKEIQEALEIEIAELKTENMYLKEDISRLEAEVYDLTPPNYR